jgi:hypothetical protein
MNKREEKQVHKENKQKALLLSKYPSANTLQSKSLDKFSEFGSLLSFAEIFRKRVPGDSFGINFNLTFKLETLSKTFKKEN